MRIRTALSVLVTLLVVPLLGACTTAHAPTVVPAAAVHAATVPAPAHRNPLTLRLTGGAQAASCADPFVFKGVKPDTNWYLYCTSDALSETERGSDGELVQHEMPTFRSRDLTTWTYTGDAFAHVPSWLTSDAGMWAPDVVFRGGRYYLYYTASDTSLPGGGSAIGVATSTRPTGPWTDSGRPVVAPADAATEPGSKRWTYDPEVVSANGRTYLYFGSYFGGVFVRELSADLMSSIPDTERRIAIDNRYEGTFIVRHGGWYYFMGSATNCCNGALTGYSVFAARSRSPLGPFRDRDGVSILAPRVGGTPALSQNGDRWVGTGHDAVITDLAGQDWIVYHAVDRDHPFYAGETDYTKRPALIDPLDWHGGWPEVRGGRGPSDTVQPGPVAQPRERATYHAHQQAPLRPGRRIAALSDTFSGTSLASRWSWVRPPAAGATSVRHGSLSWATEDADLQPPATPLASVLTERAPVGDYVVDARVRVTTPPTGGGHDYVQGGLVIYGDDSDYVKLVSNSIEDTRQTEFGVEVPAGAEGAPTYGNGVVGPVGTWTWLRIVRHHAGTTVLVTASTSLDGRHWDVGGTWRPALGAHPRIGLVSLGGAGFTSLFDSVTVSRLR